MKTLKTLFYTLIRFEHMLTPFAVEIEVDVWARKVRHYYIFGIRVALAVV